MGSKMKENFKKR